MVDSSAAMPASTRDGRAWRVHTPVTSSASISPSCGASRLRTQEATPPPRALSAAAGCLQQDIRDHRQVIRGHCREAIAHDADRGELDGAVEVDVIQVQHRQQAWKGGLAADVVAQVEALQAR